MLRKFGKVSLIVVAASAFPGCFSLNWNENVDMINSWGKDAHEMRQMTNKYLFNYDANDPFQN